MKCKFKDIVQDKDGFLRGPFGGDLKKSMFVPYADGCYKVYEQSVVLQQNDSLGEYYISKEYFQEKMSKFEVKPNDFLVSCSGVNYGAIYQLPSKIKKGIINQALLRIRLNSDIVDSKYFYYYFKTFIVNKITGGSGDSTIPNFPPMEVVKNIEIELPSIEVQRKIGNILHKLDKKIQLNNIINLELENCAKFLYDYWFLQFNFPNKNNKPYKLSGGQMKKSFILKKYVPQNWKEGKLSDYIENDKGGDWGKDNPQGNYSLKVRCFRGADIPTMNTCCISDAPIRYINKNNSFKILNNNDVIIEISGGSPTQSTGRIAYINSELINKYGSNLITSNFCKAISLKCPQFVYNFYLEWQTLYKQGVFFNYEGKTTGIKNLLYDDFINSYNTVIPDEDTIKKFYKIVDPIFNQIQRNCKEAITLIKLRDFLLPMLMNGQLTVLNSKEDNLSENKIIEKSLEFWQTHDKMDIDQFARENGILVYKDNEQKKGAVSYNKEKDLYEIAVKDPRDNFTIAHEIGHILKHKKELKNGTLGRKSEESGSKLMEYEADSLAAEILMPEEYVLKYMQDENKTDKEFLDEKFIKECAKHFDVNPPAINIRLKNLGFKVPYLK